MQKWCKAANSALDEIMSEYHLESYDQFNIVNLSTKLRLLDDANIFKINFDQIFRKQIGISIIIQRA